LLLWAGIGADKLSCNILAMAAVYWHSNLLLTIS